MGWILGIVGVLGIGGSIVLAIVAPVLAREILMLAIEIIKQIWRTRTGCAALTAAACLTFGYFYFDAEGYARCKARWDAANASAAAKVIQADNVAAEKARATDEKDTAAEAATETANEKARHDYIAELEKRASSVCTDSSADIKRLRGIR